jgi:cellulose synthase/poly-beta-1,6-N-acetylglucosamine synthase-like glycosyltransferase
VPVRNGEDTIEDCLRSLLEQDFPPERREILVVDNGSTDRTAEIVDSLGVRRVREHRRGVSHARNRGTAESRGEIVAFVDGDCVADPSWLSGMVRPFDDPEVGLVAGELSHAPARTAAERQAARMLGNWQRFAVTSDPPYAITANAAFRREVLEDIGGFDSRMTRAQDVDLGLRFQQHSPRRVVYAEGALVLHRHRTTARGFFRQQLGWAYGAGLIGAKYRGLRPQAPPRVEHVVQAGRGLFVVLRLWAGRRGRPEWVEDAWFGLLRQLAWWLGLWAGLVRGRWVWRRGVPVAPRDSEPAKLP